MAEKTVPITPKGYEWLKEEVRRLKAEERPKAIAAIAEARGHGDLSENAEYDAAKDKQGLLEAKIKSLESQFAAARVIDPSTIDASTIAFGAKVELLDLDTEAKITYQIVGDVESNIKQRKLSISSPIGKALIGKALGDVVEVNTPGGVRELEVLEIVYE